VVSVAALAYAGPAFLATHNTDVLGAMAASVLGSVPGKLLVLCVLTSTAASCQTTIMPTARAVLAMSAHGAIPRWFARMHPRFRTPTVATLGMGAVSASFYVMLTAVSKNVLADSASATGLLIAFYYGLTGFACVWFFRRDLLSGARTFLVKGILPLAGGLTLLGAFVLSIKSYWSAAASYSSFHGIGGIFLIGVGSLVVGVVLMLVTARFLPRYFQDGITAPAQGEGSAAS
jgi:amino acid transporter